jgi:hypothetical protein
MEKLIQEKPLLPVLESLQFVPPMQPKLAPSLPDSNNLTFSRLVPVPHADCIQASVPPNEKVDIKLSASEENPYSDIDPLSNFDWQATEVLKLRPFKPKYHLTMGKRPPQLRTSSIF